MNSVHLLLIDEEGNPTTDAEAVRGRQLGRLRFWNDGRVQKLVKGEWAETRLAPAGEKDPG